MKAATSPAPAPERIAATTRTLSAVDAHWIMRAALNRGDRVATAPGILKREIMTRLELAGLVRFDPLRPRPFPREAQDYRLTDFGRAVADALRNRHGRQL